jgi:hypothetical protein
MRATLKTRDATAGQPHGADMHVSVRTWVAVDVDVWMDRACWRPAAMALQPSGISKQRVSVLHHNVLHVRVTFHTRVTTTPRPHR